MLFPSAIHEVQSSTDSNKDKHTCVAPVLGSPKRAQEGTIPRLYLIAVATEVISFLPWSDFHTVLARHRYGRAQTVVVAISSVLMTAHK